MLKIFDNHITQNFPFIIGKKLLLAVSGGLDSMVLTDIFYKLGFNVSICHCNFQLRGLESDEEQGFVENYSNDRNIKLFVKKFDTKTYANVNKLSTQVAARTLRYEWFSEIIETEKYDYVLTAHHADDNLETFFINLLRGTGIDGLTGIPEQNNTIIRPLMIFSRAEIDQYAKKNAIGWREDSSNLSDNYLRNKLRHQLVPVLKKLNPDFIASLHKTQSYLEQAKSMIQDASRELYTKVVAKRGNDLYFDLEILLERENYQAYLYHWLREYGFAAWEDIYDLAQGQSGKQVLSDQFRLIKDRKHLILSSRALDIIDQEYFIQDNAVEVKIPINLSFSKEFDVSLKDSKFVQFDRDKLRYPLVLRRHKEGDSFQPLGMNGSSKKLSKFFKDEKLSLLEKEKTWLLCSDNQIVWVVGMRQDERFKIESTSKNILTIKY